ncbi:DUF192 domain-containing protein [Poritiphilus flavus]|uniref:DUF192 domain-containing protein n=1 Tax=Poritiphilus flavus TaxID=2697053 RepID=A0A6L9E965_9FLAO|nr:DUF192 domain-containing protein [Poritiphilus flavus]NAS11088.1 DUF192 domain-containing protein [Poritiphilus flavus]
MKGSKRLMVFWGLALLLAFAACKDKAKNVVETEPITFTKEGELQIFDTATDSLITRFDIEIAESDYETQTGLMYREVLEPNHGMLFVFPDVAMHSFYMKNTNIPLDLIFIDEDLKIVSFQENAKPMDETGLPSKVPVQYVLEINAGLVQKFNLKVTDSISYQKL